MATALFLHPSYRQPKAVVKKTPSSRSNTSLPTSAMLERMGGSDSDMSTFDTRKRHITGPQEAFKPRYFVSAESAVEVESSPSRHGGKRETSITVRDPPRPLSPLTTTSSFNTAGGEREDTILQTPPRTKRISQSSGGIPQAIPEAPPMQHERKKRGVSVTNLVITPPALRREQSTPNQPHPPSSRKTPPFLRGLWQKCVADCYCISSKQDPQSAIQKEEEPPELDYFQFLPSCGEEDSLEVVLPKLCSQLENPTNPPKLKASALLHLSQLCDRQRAHNRIEMVCSAERYNLVEILCKHVLMDPKVSYNNYRQALLVLSNLTLPMENKAVLLLGPQKELLLQTLHSCLTKDQQLQLEVHLVCAILYNLSFLPDGKSALCNYGGGLDNPQSLLLTLEKLSVHFQPFVAPTASTTTTATPIAASVERQALRWMFGCARNLCQDSIDNAKAIGQTRLPRVALECVGYSARLCKDSAAMGQWRAQSLEDLALGLLVELALREEEMDPLLRNAVLAPGLHQCDCGHYLNPLLLQMGEGTCIHAMRAKAIVHRFDGETSASTINKRDDSPAGKRGRKTPERKPTIVSV